MTEWLDLAIVGAGPAGLAAAGEAAEQGLSVALVDAFARPGGQYYKQTPPELGDTVAPDAYARPLLGGVDREAVRLLTGTVVWGLFPEPCPEWSERADGYLLSLYGPSGVPRRVRARTVILAPGAYDRPLPFPGWTLPGVMTAGAALTLVKHQHVLPGRRILLSGTGPLQLVLARHLLDGRAATEKRNPVPGEDPRNATEQRGMAGPWHERLPHFRLDHTPSSGDELQTEYLVPRTHAVAALRRLESLAPRMHELLLVSEIRTMAADNLWLSGAYGRDTVGFHFTWQRRPEVLDLLPELDRLLAPYDGRPHWGKLFHADAADLRSRYPRFDDFAALVLELDPHRTFRNRLLDWLLDGA